VTHAQVEAAINDVQLEPLMNWLDVNPGEMIYVDAGTIHAIGPGSILLETQQNSDTTYRLYDYGRGRELHIREGLAATKEKTHAGKVKRAATSNGTQQLVASPCFVVEKTVVREPKEFTSAGRSVEVLVALDGCGVIEIDGAKPVTIAKGECAIVPASIEKYRVRPQWAVELFCAKLPQEKAAHPVTSLV
jgi:mannose-6-phosphate isomerase